MEFFRSRIFLYLVFSIINLTIWQIANFEFAVLIALGQIAGEISYLLKQHDIGNL